MPLIINGVECTTKQKVDEFVVKYPHFKENADVYLQQDIQTVGPEKLLYIEQREFSATDPTDEIITFLGSEHATTCHIAVLRHSETGATSLLHCDGYEVEEGIESMATAVTELSTQSQGGRLDLHLFGGFLDEKKCSQEVSNSLFAALHTSKHSFHLQTACITHHNTEYKQTIPFPVIYGIAVNVKTGEIFHATFPDKGPDINIRHARYQSDRQENLNIYNPRSKHLTIPPFDYETFPNIEKYLKLPDQLIRQMLSTSPKQEKDEFVTTVRSTLALMRDYPYPLESIFKGGLPRIYNKDSTSGAWIKVD